MIQFKPLDRASAMPLYVQIADRIGEVIGSGLLAAGDTVPSEAELGSFFEVSRLTVRQAMAKLVNEGLVHRARGRGTYVRALPLVHHFGRPFEEELAAGRLRLSFVVRSWGMVQPSQDVCEALRLAPGSQAYELDRLQFVEGEPIGFERRHLPERVGRRIKTDDLLSKPVYRLVRDAVGAGVDRLVSTVSSIGASASDARQLRVAKGEPLLLRKQTYFASDDVPLMHGTAVFIGSRYSLTFECTPGQLRTNTLMES